MQQYDDKFADMRRYKPDDLIERLRSDGQQTQRDCEQAADEIERLRAALEKIKSHHMEAWGDEFQRGINFCAEKAREALGGSDE